MKLITIMAEHLGAYAWQKEEDDGTTWVGGNIADTSSGFEFSEFWVSPGLEQAFADWMSIWADIWDDPTADDWPSFHERGIELSRRLKEQLADQTRVIYHKCGEDPDERFGTLTKRIEILSDGSLKWITVRRWSPPNEEK
jgi:hypothetical protein